MFKIIGGDGKEYGPVTTETIRDWLRQGRANGGTQVLPEGAANWVELRALPEFQADLAERPPLPRPADVPAGNLTGAVLPAGPRSSLATASLVLGILGFLTIGVTAVVGLVLGIVAVVRIHGSQGRLGGKGLATAGIVTSALALMFVPMIAILAGLLLPALAQSKSKAQQIVCMSNLKQLVLGVRMYSTDNKDTFPTATNWSEAISTYVASPRPFQCPTTPGARSSYAYNLKVSGLEDGKVDPQTVVLFESNLGWNGAGGPEAMAHRHGSKGVLVAFADGHVEVVMPARLSSLRWNP